MPFSKAASGIVAGVGLTVYGGYKYLTAGRKPAYEVSQQKKVGLVFVAVGVTAIAVGAGLIYSATGPIHVLKDILNKGGRDSITAKTFKVLEDTQGISYDNYLPWQDEFHLGGTGYIDGIDPKHLGKPAMWGIDQWNRPYVAIKYVCNQTIQGAVALFQRYSSSGDPMVWGGSHKAEGCDLGPLDPAPLHYSRDYSRTTEFLGNLTSLFKGKNVVAPTWGGRVSILTLAK